MNVKQYNKNYIPIMDEPKMKHWRQPIRSEIIVDDKHAVMAKSTFDELQDYPEDWHHIRAIGKMCRNGDWFYWYGHSKTQGMVSCHHRKIIIL